MCKKIWLVVSEEITNQVTVWDNMYHTQFFYLARAESSRNCNLEMQCEYRMFVRQCGAKKYLPSARKLNSYLPTYLLHYIVNFLHKRTIATSHCFHSFMIFLTMFRRYTGFLEVVVLMLFCVIVKCQQYPGKCNTNICKTCIFCATY